MLSLIMSAHCILFLWWNVANVLQEAYPMYLPSKLHRLCNQKPGSWGRSHQQAL